MADFLNKSLMDFLSCFRCNSRINGRSTVKICRNLNALLCRRCYVFNRLYRMLCGIYSGTTQSDTGINNISAEVVNVLSVSFRVNPSGSK